MTDESRRRSLSATGGDAVDESNAGGRARLAAGRRRKDAGAGDTGEHTLGEIWSKGTAAGARRRWTMRRTGQGYSTSPRIHTARNGVMLGYAEMPGLPLPP